MTLNALGSYVTGTSSEDAAGRVINRSLGNGTAISNTYNLWTIQGGRLSNITSVQSGVTRQNLGYTYDAVGNITRIADALGLTTSYTYDGLNRLQSATESTNADPEYDPTTGNLLYMDGNEQIPTLYGYNDPEHAHAVTQKGGRSQQYYYDANGNMIQRPSRTLQYNAENQLTSVSGTPSATFVYDGDGNRVLTTVGTTTTAYIGNHTEWNVTAQEMTRYYLAGGQRIAFRVIKSGQADKVFYLLADHLGSTNVVMQVGGVVETKTYTAWGKDRTGSISKTDRQYTGQINKSELGLYFYNARYYDPDLGRFTSADSIVPQPGNPQAWDRYSYVHNSPTNKADPSGHMPIQGCGDEGKSACTATQQEIQNWVIFQYESNEIKCQEGNRDFCIGYENGTSRPITGIQYGSSLTMDLFYGKYIYEQTDYLLDWKSGTIFKVITEGEGKICWNDKWRSIGRLFWLDECIWRATKCNTKASHEVVEWAKQ